MSQNMEELAERMLQTTQNCVDSACFRHQAKGLLILEVVVQHWMYQSLGISYVVAQWDLTWMLFDELEVPSYSVNIMSRVTGASRPSTALRSADNDNNRDSTRGCHPPHQY